MKVVDSFEEEETLPPGASRRIAVVEGVAGLELHVFVRRERTSAVWLDEEGTAIAYIPAGMA